MVFSRIGKLTLAFGMGAALAGCQADQPFAFLKGKPAETASTAPAATPATENSVKLVDRDVEAPDIYHKVDKALWDGRPSLGGVWVAAPDVTEPQRVLIRNQKNGKFVIGALFRREQMLPGPKLQLSSDAAEALGMLAGQPTEVTVVALKRVEQPVAPPNPQSPALDSNMSISQKSLAPVGGSPAPTKSATAGGALPPPARPAAAAQAGKPQPAAPAVPAASADRAYAQIGIFSVETNANRAAKLMKKHGLDSAVVKEQTHDKTFWRVLIGPTSPANRDALLAKVKSLGFADAYFVTR